MRGIKRAKEQVFALLLLLELFDGRQRERRKGKSSRLNGKESKKRKRVPGAWRCTSHCSHVARLLQIAGFPLLFHPLLLSRFFFLSCCFIGGWAAGHENYDLVPAGMFSSRPELTRTDGTGRNIGRKLSGGYSVPPSTKSGTLRTELAGTERN